MAVYQAVHVSCHVCYHACSLQRKNVDSLRKVQPRSELAGATGSCRLQTRFNRLWPCHQKLRPSSIRRNFEPFIINPATFSSLHPLFNTSILCTAVCQSVLVVYTFFSSLAKLQGLAVKLLLLLLHLVFTSARQPPEHRKASSRIPISAA